MNSKEINGYTLSKAWFDYVLDNPDKATSNHTALYLWLVEINNRCSWREKFQITAKECMDGMSCKSRTTYTKCFHDLIDWGFIQIVVKSTNQYQCNVISLYTKWTTNNTTTDTTTDTTNGQPIIQSLDNHVDYSKTNKPLNKKTNKPLNKENKINTTPLKKDDLIEKSKKSFINTGCVFGTRFKNAWIELLEQPKWIKKNDTAIETALKQLMEFDEEFALNQVQCAISGGWQGVVFANTKTNYIKSKSSYKSTQQSIDEKQQGRDKLHQTAEDVLAAIAAKHGYFHF